MPISSRVAQNLMRSIQPINRTIATAKDVFKATWTEGGLNVSYTIGESADPFTIQNRNKYTLKKVWNTLITIPGTRAADRYVIIGAQRDSLNAGAVSPGSGNAVFLEVLRGIGDLLTSGWMPHRTLLLASFDGEQFGSVGSSEWIDRHFAHLGGRGVVYLNLRDVVRGSGPIHVEAAAAVRSTLFKRAAEVTQPSPEVNMENFTMKFLQGNTSTTSSEFHPLLLPQDQEQEQNQNQNQNATTTLHQAEGSTKDEDFQSSLLPLNSSFGHQDLSDQKDSIYASWLEETKKKNNDPLAKSPQVFLPGLQHRISPFLARLGIPSLEIRFDGGYYGVENGQNDSFEWMRRFGDPTFTYHRAAAQLYGNILLSYSDSIFLQYDFIEVARELRFGKAYLAEMLTKIKNINLPLSRLEASIQMFERAALAINKELRQVSVEMVNIITGELVVDLQRVREINTRLLMTEKAFLLPGGIPHMPWLKHVSHSH
jgi:N-acetylated-alpha-linked acidic dipeptidase